MAAIQLYAEGISEPGRVRIAKCTVGAGTGSNIDVQFTSQTTKAIFNVPANVMVLDMFAYTRTAWTASVTINVGDGDNTAGWIATAKVAPQTVNTTNLLPIRTTLATAGAFASGKMYTTADTIDIVLAGATPLVGETDFYVMYIGPFDDVNM